MPLNILSLGAGIQSSAVLLMSCRGMLPKLDAAVFADTGWEPQAVYDTLTWLEEQAATARIPVHRVTCGRDIRRDTMVAKARGAKVKGERYASMPLHVTSETGRGMITRQCTREYKIEPIEKFVRRTILGLNPGQRAKPGSVRQWFGISSDEMRRIRISDKRWKEHVYPLCGIPDRMLDRPWARLMCRNWLEENYPDQEFVRSACIGCPFKSNAEWRVLKQGEHWADAVEVDATIRKSAGMRGESFLHRSCRPLAVANLDEDQAEMWGDECLGYCGN